MEIQGKYVKNMRKYKGTIIVLIVCMIFAYLYAHVDKKEYFYNRTVDVGKYSNTGVICEKKLTQDVYSTEKSLDGIQVKTQNVGDCTNIKIKITIEYSETAIQKMAVSFFFCYQLPICEFFVIFF